MTQEFLLDALVADLKELFRHHRLKNSQGIEREIQVFAQDLPIREDSDEPEDPEAVPEPFVVARILGGKTEDDNAQQIITAVIVVCVCDYDTNRQGFRDALHIINEIYHHYSVSAVIGKKWEVLYPMEWTIQQEDDHHPYYYAGMTLNIQAPAVHKEVPEV